MNNIQKDLRENCEKRQTNVMEAQVKCLLDMQDLDKNLEIFIDDPSLPQQDSEGQTSGNQDKLLTILQKENNDLGKQLETEKEEKVAINEQLQGVSVAYSNSVKTVQFLESQVLTQEQKLKDAHAERKELENSKSKLSKMVKEMYEACKHATEEVRASLEAVADSRESNDSLQVTVRKTKEKVTTLKERHLAIFESSAVLRNELQGLRGEHSQLQALAKKNQNFLANIQKRMNECFSSWYDSNNTLESSNWDIMMLLENEMNAKSQYEAKVNELQDKVNTYEEQKVNMKQKQAKIERELKENSEKMSELEHENEKLLSSLEEAEKREVDLKNEMQRIGTFNEIDRKSMSAVHKENVDEIRKLERDIAQRKETILKKDEIIQNLSDEICVLRKCLSERSTRVESLELELKSFKSELDDNESRLSCYSNQVEELQTKIVIANKKLKESERENESLQDIINELEEKQRDLSASQKNYFEELTRKTKDTAETSSKLLGLEKQATEHGERIKLLEKEKENLEEQVEQLKQQILKQDEYAMHTFKELTLKHKEEQMELVLEYNASGSKVAELMRRQDQAQDIIKKLEEENLELVELHPQLEKCQQIMLVQQETESNLRKKIDDVSKQLKEAEGKAKKAHRQKAAVEKEKQALQERLKTYEKMLKDKEQEYLSSTKKLIQVFEKELSDC